MCVRLRTLSEVYVYIDEFELVIIGLINYIEEYVCMLSVGMKRVETLDANITHQNVHMLMTSLHHSTLRDNAK